jgi:aquaporin Z
MGGHAINHNKHDTPNALRAEFTGTFLLVLTVGLVTLVGANNAALKDFGGTAIGCVLAVLVYALANVSGAHLNPAVTFAVLMRKGISYTGARDYVFMQCLGAALAGLATGWIHGFTGPGVIPAMQPIDKYWLGAPLVELLYTAMLVFVVMNVTRKVKKTEKGYEISEQGEARPYYGVAIGFVIIAGAYGGGAVSGGCFNPAVAFGLEFMRECNPARALGGGEKCAFNQAFNPDIVFYIVAELAGAFAAVTAFHIVRPEEKQEQKYSGFFHKLTEFAFWIESKFDAEDTSEFLGTFFLCLTISLNSILAEVKPSPIADPAAIWSIAASLMCMIYAVGDVSGGLFNPALTLSMALRYWKTEDGLEGPQGYDQKLADPMYKNKDGKHALKEIPKYLLCQFVGGAASSGMTILIYMLSGLYPAATIAPKFYTDKTTGNKVQYNEGQAFFAEAFGTFLLCFVFLSVVTSKETKSTLEEYAAFAIGGCIIGGGYAWGPLSGGILNPAVTIATSVVNFKTLATPSPWLYVLAQVVGGLLAAVMFRFVIYSNEFSTAAKVTDPSSLTTPLKESPA